MVSKCKCVMRGDGVVVEAAVEGPKKAEHVVGAARGSVSYTHLTLPTNSRV